MSSELLLLGIQQDTVTYGWGTLINGRLNNNLNSGNFVIPPTLITDKNFSSVYGSTNSFFGISGVSLWCWGLNSFGIFGQNNNDSTSSPIQIAGNWSKFARGFNHVLGIKSDGTLWAWGNNAYGQLGTGNTQSYSSPVQIGSNTWLEVAAGSAFSIALRSDNTVWTFGLDTDFQLGQGLSLIGNHRSSPVQIAGGGTYTNVFAGTSTGYAIRSDNTLYGWGQNNSSGVPVGYYYLLATGVPTTTNAQSAPVQISSSTGWQKVSCNADSVLAIKNYELFAWGTNNYGQLGTGNYTTYSSPVQVGADTWSDVVVNTTSFGIRYPTYELYSWGGYSYGGVPVAGISIYPPPTSPTLVNNSLSWQNVYYGLTTPTNSTPFACTNQVGVPNLYGWGQIANETYPSYAVLIGQTPTRYSSPVQITSQLNLFSKITSSTLPSYLTPNPDASVMAITKDKQVYAWGGNRFGQLGDGTVIPRSSPVLISSASHENALSGSAFTIFLRSNGTIWATGNNYDGYLGNNSLISVSSPVQIGSNTNWTNIAVNDYASHAINSLNNLYAWGSANRGEFGNGTQYPIVYSSPVFIGTDYVSGYGAGASFFAIKTNGSLWSTGENTIATSGVGGLLGRGTGFGYSTTLTQIFGTYTYPWVKVAPAPTHVLALNSNGDVYGWGANFSGQLGIYSYLGTVAPPTFIASGVSDIGTGTYISYFIRDGILYGFGTNYNGGLGLNNTSITSYSSPTQIGTFTGWTNISPFSDGYSVLGIAKPI